MNTSTQPRQRKTYTQPSEDSIDISFYTAQEMEEHQILVKKLIRAEEPKTFKEYQQWLHDWRRAWKREMQVNRECGVAYARYKLAGGFGRYEKNCAYKMTPKIEEAYARAIANARAHRAEYGSPHFAGYGVQNTLLAMRIARKPLGKALWEAESVRA